MVSKVVVSTVDQQIQNGQDPKFLQQLLANPTAIGQKDRQQLETLVETYPQCSIFHLLLAKAAQNGEAATAGKTLQSAAIYAANREVLFRLIHQPEQIIAPKEEKIYPFVKAETLNPDASFTHEIPVKDEAEVTLSEKNAFAESYPIEIINTAFEDEKVVPVEEEVILLEGFIREEKLPAENVDASFTDGKLLAEDFPDETIITEEKPSVENVDASFTGENLVAEPLSAKEEETHSINPNQAEEILVENDLRVEDVNLNFVNEPAGETIFPAEEEANLQQQTNENIDLSDEPETAKPSFSGEIDEEVYDEIIAIEDIRFEVVKTASPEEKQTAAETEKTVEKPLLNVQDKAEKDMLSSIASIDYFTFNNKFGQNHTNQSAAVAENKTEDVAVKTEVSSAQKEAETVSKYHDDKMPYSFMWWLDKTRKEHAGTYQPYAKTPTAQPETGLTAGPELNQQYIESIFHTKPVHEMVESSLPPVVQPVANRKEDRLIERFIIEEPHIHPPSSDKLDTENKAKKSSEDGDVLVTETLAKIYLDQMLYHKALDTYKKLVLKFPEKSSYFAAQIESIEKKIN